MGLMVWLVCVILSVSTFAEKKEWNNNLEGVVTRCFRSETIKIICDHYPDLPTAALKDINLTARDSDGINYGYSYGRAIPAEMCNRHSKRIKSLLEKTKQACITGDVEIEIHRDKNTEREFSLHWLAFETAKGEVHRNF